ncbi:MAG: LysR family transcriptional regulator [Ectothiorhodospiraceae bacterium]|nr:LysR family transcriptional regulator [Ectothiorhodospiraceae bacterium]
MESQLGFPLFDRSGYRLRLTKEGKAVYRTVKRVIKEVAELKIQATHLREGEETELNIVLGDLTPKDQSLKTLRSFSKKYPQTRINLLFENLNGPCERLLNGEADLIIHHVDPSDSRYEYKEYCEVPVVPVIAPEFYPHKITQDLRYSDLKDYTQCIITDTAKQQDMGSHFVNEDSPCITVGDQHTKKQVIMQSMAWGHMPLFMVEDEIQSGALVMASGKSIKGIIRRITVARLSKKSMG